MKLTTREIILCGLFAALVSIFAQISIPLPFTTVPLTLQIFGIAITGDKNLYATHEFYGRYKE